MPRLNSFRIIVLSLSALAGYYYFTKGDVSLPERRASVSGVSDKCFKNGLFAFTFDEGPGKFTKNVLNTAKSCLLPLTFHVVATHLDEQAYQANLKQAYGDGHLIGLRFRPEYNPMQLTNDQLVGILIKDSEKVFGLIKKYPKYLRFPFGQYTIEHVKLAQSLGFIVTEWNIDAYDYSIEEDPVESGYIQIDDYIRSKLATGSPKTDSFISLHRDLYTPYKNISGLCDTASFIKEKGYVLVKLAQCLGQDEGSSPYRSKNVDTRFEETDPTNSQNGQPKTTMNLEPKSDAVNQMFAFNPVQPLAFLFAGVWAALVIGGIIVANY